MNFEMQLLTLKDFLKRGARYSAPVTQEESQGSVARTNTSPPVDLTFCEDVSHLRALTLTVCVHD